jgi:hypothetical protein
MDRDSDLSGFIAPAIASDQGIDNEKPHLNDAAILVC